MAQLVQIPTSEILSKLRDTIKSLEVLENSSMNIILGFEVKITKVSQYRYLANLSKFEITEKDKLVGIRIKDLLIFLIKKNERSN